jgi:hypothetical protein
VEEKLKKISCDMDNCFSYVYEAVLDFAVLRMERRKQALFFSSPKLLVHSHLGRDYLVVASEDDVEYLGGNKS